MLKKVYDFIDIKVRRNGLITAVTWLICGILLFFWVFFFLLDSTPATLADYTPLIEQNNTLKDNFSAVYSYDNYEILPNKNNISITLSNSQCKLECIYDKDFKFVDYKEEDLAISKLESIFVSIILGFFILGGIATWIISIFLPFMIYYLLKIIEWLCLLLVGKR